jgi:hypothetical protein
MMVGVNAADMGVGWDGIKNGLANYADKICEAAGDLLQFGFCRHNKLRRPQKAQ